jgi:hypothetical protein
LVLRVR